MGRPAAWGPATVNEILHRVRYTGLIQWNRTRRRAPDGSRTFAVRPESEWIRIERPELRIIDDATWTAAHARLAAIRDHLLTVSGGRFRRRDSNSPDLLSGMFTRCAACGGLVGVLDRRQYGCIANHKKGMTVCRNAVKVPIATLDAAVVRTLSRDVLRPRVVAALVERVIPGICGVGEFRDHALDQAAHDTGAEDVAALVRA